ncbi:MAG: MBL fold metallo-hydrolase [Bacteroidia bacterium]|jgi:glyoxylase-like metal-dependent hydrolase (beta-lactamase superfamily II)/rhodanese-related sulfurtransferase|nr:MBL fold metallo-hydrolase [Bacteroidia bacterium]
MKHYVEQMYTGCLAEAAYYIESNGEAAIIDPLREVDPYIQKAKERGAKIKYVFETHFHADFVSGHLDLAKKTGAQIVYGPMAEPNFDAYIAKDGEEFKIGDITIKVLHTPGHTLESSTYLLIDEEGKPRYIFTGDTLFIGDVGRPDLAVKGNLTEKELASLLYDSLRNKIMPLPDDIIVYPGHGAGSACGKNIGKETFDTLGNQKKKNWALQNISKEEFVKEATTGLLPPPQYFPKNALLNKLGYESIDVVLEREYIPLSVSEFKEKMKTGALVLDVRSSQEFAAGHIPGSINIGLDGGPFAVWVGALIEDLNTPILIVTPEGRERETIIRLARVGYENCLGYLEGGISSWKNAGEKLADIHQIDAAEFVKRYNVEDINVIDVRKPTEYERSHLEKAKNIPLDFIQKHLSDFSNNEKYYIHCAGGYRSMIACSILKKNGIENITDVKGGFSAIAQQENVNIVETSCAS